MPERAAGALGNAGASAANGATVTVPLPTNVSAFTAWTCTASGGAWRWS